MDNYFFRTFHTEWIKLRSTVAVKLAIIAPLLIVIIYAVVMTHFEETIIKRSLDTWLFFTNVIWNFWSSFALLPLIGIQTSLINNVEHGNEGWRNIFTLPVPKQLFFISKLLWSIILIFISLCFISIFIVLAGYSLTFIVPSLKFQNFPLPWELLVLKPFYAMFGSLAIVSFHYFFSVYFKNMFISTGFAFIITITTMFIIQNEKIAILFPWCWPALATTLTTDPFSINGIIKYRPIILSFICFLIFTIVNLRFNHTRRLI